MDLDADNPRPCPGAIAEPAASDTVLALLRSLVTALSPRTLASADGIPFEGEGDEVLLDADADGYRYMLLRAKSQSSTRAHLSPREQEIARMVAAGYPSKAIASVLNISCWTVGTHLRRIYAKLGVNTRAGMVGRMNELRIGAHERTPAPAPAAAPLERKRA